MTTKRRAGSSPLQTEPARIEYLRVQNYPVLGSIELKDLTPLTVLLGPNGSGKSTGDLWLEGHFGVGDPLVNGGSPRMRTKQP